MTALNGQCWAVWGAYDPSLGSFMQEGFLSSEVGLTDYLDTWGPWLVSSWTQHWNYRLPQPPGGILKAGTYAVCLRGPWLSVGGVGQTKVQLACTGGTFASPSVSMLTSESDVWFTIVIGADADSTYLQLQVWEQTTNMSTLYFRYGHVNTCFGVESGSTGPPRSTVRASTIAPGPGSHAAPSVVATPTPLLTADMTYVYPTDIVSLVKYADTSSGAAHSPSAPTTQTVGAASAATASVDVALMTRRIAVTPDATRKCDTGHNTYDVLTVTDYAGGALATLPWELLLGVTAATLTTLNGATAPTYVTTTDLEPWVEWMDPNVGLTTLYRVWVYRATDDHLMYDSGETAVRELQCQIPLAAGLVSFVTYYVVVTLMRGSGGSEWSLDTRGYFQTDCASTAVKITNIEGTADAPVIITTTTPEIEWYFAKTQQSFMVSVFDEGLHAAAFNTPWTVSPTESYTIPAHT